MRWVFLAITVLLLEGLTYGAARGVQWGLTPWLTAKTSRYVLWALFAFSNGLLLAVVVKFSGMGLKLLMSWLTVLWLFILAMLATWLVHLLVSKLLLASMGASTASGYTLWGVRGLLAVMFVGLVGLGVYNAYMPVVRRLTIQTNQPLAKPLRIGLVSDLHLGRLIGQYHLKKLQAIVKDEHIELLLMAGDIMDDNTDEYNARNMQPTLSALVHAVPLGVYASLGNHDMYGHEAQIRRAIEDAGIHLLTDSRALVDQRLWLVGRLDDHAKYRKPTADLLPPNNQLPIVLLDHEPSQIAQNVALPIDVQLSGHTHNGQIFPANFIVKAMYRLAYGHERIHNTDVIVSSGYGLWGVPFRLGSQSEVWVIDLIGSNQSANISR